MKRPSFKEIDGKLRQARAYLSEKNGSFVNPTRMVSDLRELGLVIPPDIWPFVRIALSEISAKNYAGTYPPALSYEKAVLGCESWAFCWESAHFGKKMYLRFFITKKGEYFHSSMHESKPEKKI